MTTRTDTRRADASSAKDALREVLAEHGLSIAAWNLLVQATRANVTVDASARAIADELRGRGLIAVTRRTATATDEGRAFVRDTMRTARAVASQPPAEPAPAPQAAPPGRPDAQASPAPPEEPAPSHASGRISPAQAIDHILAIAKRNLLHTLRTPQLLVFSSIQPVLFVLLFRYVFGGAIPIPGFRYVDYLMPGIFVQTTLFGGMGTAGGMAEDLKSGVIDRFRSLPMARSAVLAGRTFADLVRTAATTLLMVVVGVLVGFRFNNGILPGVAAFLLVILFGYTFSWLFALIGMAVKDPETAQVAGILPIFPFVFASSAFVPIQTMPGWLQAFAKVQPVSITVDAVRVLTQGGAVASKLWQSLAWIAVFLVVLVPLAVRQYRRT